MDMDTCDAINWIDDFEMSSERTVFTSNELHIPGLRMFGELHPDKSVKPLKLHYHENAFEISFITRGSINFIETDKEIPTSGGSVHISFPNEVHSTGGLPIASVHMYWMQLDVSNPDEFLFLNTSAAQEIIRRLYQIKTHIIATDNALIRQLIKCAFSQCRINGDPMLISGYILTFLELLLNFSDKQQNLHTTPVDIQLAINYINEHYDEQIDMATLAAISKLSVSQFKQKFSHYVGIPPRQYINRTKISNAKNMLKNGVSITETAMALGFNNPSYFSSVFKKYQSCSPKEYAQKHKNDKKQPET